MTAKFSQEVISVARSVIPPGGPLDDNWPDYMDAVAVQVLDECDVDLSYDDVNELMDLIIRGEV